MNTPTQNQKSKPAHPPSAAPDFRFQSSFRFRSSTFGFLLALAFTPSVRGALRLWTGAGPNAFWSTPSNWNPSGPPQNGDDLGFVAGMPRQTSTNDLSGRAFHSFIFNGSGSSYVFYGADVQLTTGVNSLQFPGTATINLHITLNANQDFIADGSTLVIGDDIALNGHTLTLRTSTNSVLNVNGAITGTGDVVKLGTGLASFSGLIGNSYQGTLYVTEGTLSLGKISGVAVPGDLIIGDLNAFLFGNVMLTRPNMIADSATITINHGELDMNGWDETVGPLRLYDGDIKTGTATLVPLGKISQPSWVYTRYPSISGHIYLPSDTTFDLYGSGDSELSISASISGVGGIIKTGDGILRLANTNDFTGAVTVNDGELHIDGSTRALGNSPSVTLNDYGIIALDGYELDPKLNKPLTLTSAHAGIGAVSGTCTISSTINLNFTGQAKVSVGDGSNLGTLRLTGPIHGTGGLWFGGANIELTAHNDFTGGVRSACRLLSLNTGAFAPFSGPLDVGGSYYPLDYWLVLNRNHPATNSQNEVRFLDNAFQFIPAATLHDNGWINLNGHDNEFGSLDMTGGRISSGAGKLYLDGPVVTHAAQTTATIEGLAQLSTFPAVSFDITDGTAAPDLGISAVVSDGVPSGIHKSGGGEMLLSGANTYRNATTVSEGIMWVRNDFALGAGSSTTVLDGATLYNETADALAEPLTLSGSGVGGTNGALLLGPATGVQANITLATNATIRNDVSFAILSGVISGPGGLVKSGAGTLQLGGGSGADNTYSGDTVVAGGVLVPFKGAGITTVPGHLIIGTGAINTSATFRHFSSFTILGSVTVNRGGLWDLNGFAEGFTPSLLGGHPPLALNNGGDVQTGSGIVYLPPDGGIVVNPGVSLNASSSISGNLGLDAGTHRISVGPGFPNPLNPLPECDLTAAVAETSASASLIKDGSGTLRVSANNSFSGALTISNGTLLATSAGALGSGSQISVHGAGSLALDGGGISVNKSLTLNSSDPNHSALDCRSGSNTWNAPITLNATSGIRVNPTSAYLQVLQTISGPGGLAKLGAGDLQFWGFGPNTYAGPTTILEGLIDAGRVNQISIPGDLILGNNVSPQFSTGLRILREQQVNPNANITLNRSGIFWLWDFPNVPHPVVRVRALPGGGLIHIDPASTLTISNETNFRFDGLIEGSGPLVKSGSARMEWTGSGSPYSGLALIGDGDFLMNGTAPSMPVQVRNDAVLRGDGQVNGVAVFETGTLGADSKLPQRQGGDLSLATLTLSSTANVDLDFFGPSPTGGDDQIVASSSVNLNSANFHPHFRYPPHEGDVITALNRTSAGALNGTFTGWPQGSIQTVDGIPCRINYSGGNGNDLQLTVTNLALKYFSYALAEGNGNQTVEPDECNLLYVTLLNRRASPVTITNAVLRVITSNAVVTIPSARYPVVPSGGTAANLTPFQFRTDPTMPCEATVSFELVLGISGEGEFAVAFSPVSGSDCSHPTGPCESCVTATGQFGTNTPTLAAPPYFVGAPSICFPPKAFPGVDPSTNPVPAQFITHTFRNNTTNSVCVTAQLEPACVDAPPGTFGVAAYLGAFKTNDFSAGYLGDVGDVTTTNYPPFSFNVPAGSNFVVVIVARTNLCDRYTLELFGLDCPPPTLAISHEAAPDKVRVDWSTAYPGWIAQRSGRLGEMFNNLLPAPAILDGRYALTNLPAVTNGFFRLHKP